MEVEVKTTTLSKTATNWLESKQELPVFPFIEFESAENYHAKSKSGEFVSSHFLEDFRVKGPLFYHKKTNGEIPDKDSPAYLIGRAVHTFILEGDERFDQDYEVTDGPINDKTGNPYGKETKTYKEWFSLQDKQIISTLDFALIETMADSVRNHSFARKLLSRGVAESVVRAQIKGVSCQIRCDWLSSDYGIVDLKTCDDLDWFEYDAKKYGYYHQLAFYQRVVFEASDRMPLVYIIAVEKKEPFRCGVWGISGRTLETASNENLDALSRLQECRDKNIWPTGYEEIRILETKYL